MAAQKLNLLHILLAIGALACLGFAAWENRQRTISLKRHFWSSTWCATLTALMLLFFQAGMKQPVWQVWATLPVGLAIGVVFGLTLALKVDRSWSIPRPAAARRMIWIGALLVVMVAIEIAGAAMGPEWKQWRHYATMGTMACAGIFLGRAATVMVRIRLKVG